MTHPNRAPRILSVLAHPAQDSLTATLNNHIVGRLTSVGLVCTTVDLVDVGFDSTFGAVDLRRYRDGGSVDTGAAIAKQQRLVEQADALVFAFPVYWWTVPAILKGWFDRVLTNGWAYSIDESGKVNGLLRDRPVRIVAVASGSAETYQRHGYTQAMSAQIVHGIFEFCGFDDVSLEIMHDSEDPDMMDRHLGRADEVARSIAARLSGGVFRSGASPQPLCSSDIVS